MSRTKRKFEVGDWVVFEDARTRYEDLSLEADWSDLDGMVGIVTRVDKDYPNLLWVKRMLGGPWPDYDKESVSIDPRHFTLLVKKSDIRP